MDFNLQERAARLQRPEDSQLPDDRNFGDSYNLTIDSLETLRPQAWLDDSVVKCFFKSLCLARPGEFVAFDSNALDLLRIFVESAPTQEAIDELYRPHRTLAATVTGNGGLVFMPFCIEDHWILVVADFQRPVIRVYDSLVAWDKDNNMIACNPRVDAILPHVRAALSFGIEEIQWPVEFMLLPVKPTTQDCGVYICLMALHHAYMSAFTPGDYVITFRGTTFKYKCYSLDECYWLAGRKTILEVCKRYLKPASDDTERVLHSINQELTDNFRKCFRVEPHGYSINQLMPYFDARSWTLQRIINALKWVTKSIGNLGSTERLPHGEFIEHKESIQSRAREVALAPAGEPFRYEIVSEAIEYAWHDGKALQNLRSDLISALDFLISEKESGHHLLHEQAAQEDWKDIEAQVGGDTSTEQTPSVTEHGSPSSPDIPDQE